MSKKRKCHFCGREEEGAGWDMVTSKSFHSQDRTLRNSSFGKWFRLMPDIDFCCSCGWERFDLSDGWRTLYETILAEHYPLVLFCIPEGI